MNELLVTFIAVTLLVLLLVSGIFLALIISSKQRLRFEMDIAETRIAYEKELRTVENEVTESVLGRFSRELHDNIGQLLTALQVQMQNQKLEFPELADKMRPADIYISEISQQLRLLSRTLNKEYTGHAGLFKSLEIEAERLRGLRRFNVHFDSLSGKSNLDPDQELMVLRICQEIIQNALKYSSAENFYIKVYNEGDNFKVTLQDDGVGFDLDSTMASVKGSGLRNIRHRAQLAGLECEMQSSPGKGSLFIIGKSRTLGETIPR